MHQIYYDILIVKVFSSLFVDFFHEPYPAPLLILLSLDQFTIRFIRPQSINKLILRQPSISIKVHPPYDTHDVLITGQTSMLPQE
jgi:predicted AlkP superfamily pyrophosphatase or phosphodiesterase